MGIILIIMKLNLMKRSMNIRAFSKLKSSFRSFLIIHDFSSFILEASLYSTHSLTEANYAISIDTHFPPHNNGRNSLFFDISGN